MARGEQQPDVGKDGDIFHWASRTPGPKWLPVVGALLALVVSMALWARHLRNILGTPSAISQTFDNIFHINAVRYILNSRDGSSLTLGNLGAGGSRLSFYPGAWHDIVSLVCQAGTSIPVSSNAVMFVVVSIVWTSSLLSLTWIMGCRRFILQVVTAVMGASFPAFPIMLMDFGVLYPNLLGLSMVPAIVALTLELTGSGAQVPSGRRELTAARTVLLGLATGLGLGLSHPNAILSFIAVALAILAAAGLRALSQRSWRATALWGLALAGAILAARMVWIAARPPFDGWQWGSVHSVSTAIGEAIMQAPMDRPPSWTLTIFVVLGAAVAVRKRHVWWLFLSALALTFLWVVASSWPIGPDRFFWVWPWYCDPFRLAAALPLAMAPLGILGAASLIHGLLWASRRAAMPSTVLVVGGTCAVIALVLATQRTAAMNWAVDHASKAYEINSHSALLTNDELAVLNDVRRIVPRDAVIVTDPWNGSSLAYGLADRATTTTQPLYELSPQMILLTGRLGEAGVSPEVCRALDELDAHYVLAFGDPEINGYRHDWTGFDHLEDHPGFEVLSRHGNAALYQITACE